MIIEMRGRNSRYLALLVLPALLLFAGCRSQEPAKEVPLAAKEKAAAAVESFRDELVSTLMSALEDGGPENAIRICKVEAPRIAEDQAVDGMRMGRTSHRVRNPDNAPEPWMEPMIQAYLADPDLDEPKAVWLEDGRMGYAEPIRLMPFCLGCHGPKVEPALMEQIRELYPDDQATGFRVGDLRGLFWVTLPVEEG
jgi:hypothetical protein